MKHGWVCNYENSLSPYMFFTRFLIKKIFRRKLSLDLGHITIFDKVLGHFLLIQFIKNVNVIFI